MPQQNAGAEGATPADQQEASPGPAGSISGDTAMEYRRLGRTALRVSPICLGTMNFGPLTSEPDSFAIMDRALAEGINFFDSADVYGRQRGEGITEQIVGKWFAQGNMRRERVVIATKVFGDMDRPPELADPNMARGLS